MSDFVSPEATSDDKLWAALSYVFSPLVPLIIMFAMPDKKDRPFLRYHYMQALIFGVIGIGISVLTSGFLIGLCLGPLYFIAALYFAYQAYQGKYVNIPVVTDFAKRQGWL